MALGITVDQIIENKFGPYLDSLTPEKRQEFLNSMKEAAMDMLNQKIAEAEALYKGIKTTADNVITAAKVWPGQISAIISTPDPMAPIASAATLVSLQQAVSMAKANIDSAAGQLSQLQTIILAFGFTPGGPVDIINSLSSLVNTASTALSVIPL